MRGHVACMQCGKEIELHMQVFWMIKKAVPLNYVCHACDELNNINNHARLKKRKLTDV